ncbi:MAG: hypothetical protein KA746_12840 [Pyrinomonadaceae bacterium]|nr:hypothetical protein [Pyrinomonadaceae bacterium]MBP6212062.1 hypothetical protein [Pyrinomonadaceae bacterium]
MKAPFLSTLLPAISSNGFWPGKEKGQACVIAILCPVLTALHSENSTNARSLVTARSETAGTAECRWVALGMMGVFCSISETPVKKLCRWSVVGMADAVPIVSTISPTFLSWGYLSE